MQVTLIIVFRNPEIREAPQRIPALKEYKAFHQELAKLLFW